MIKAKVQGKPIDFPSSWSEVSFKDSLKFLDTPPKAEAIRRILGIEPGQKVEGLETLYAAAKFLDKPVELEETPTTIGTYTLPQDITLETTEQFEDISNEIKRVWESKDLRIQTEALPYYVAIYIQPAWFGTAYDGQQAKRLAVILADFPCPEVMSAGAFFQARYLSSESGLPVSYLLKNLPLKKKKQDSTNFLKRLGRMFRWTR